MIDWCDWMMGGASKSVLRRVDLLSLQNIAISVGENYLSIYPEMDNLQKLFTRDEFTSVGALECGLGLGLGLLLPPSQGFW